MAPILEMKNITKTFPGVKALSNVSFQVEQGEIHCLVGENGAGKSTLMKVLSGVYPHGSYSGEIIFNGQEQKFASIRDSEKAGIAIIYQELALVPELTVYENIFLGNEIKKGMTIDWNETIKRSVEALQESEAEPEPRDAGQEPGRWQTATRRDRQGTEQGCQAADPGRADRGLERGRQREPARADPRASKSTA